MTPVQEYAQRTLSYLEQDLATFEAVVATPSFRGKIGVAMITNVCAALDLFTWLLYQRFDLTIKNHDLFKRLTTAVFSRFAPQPVDEANVPIAK